MQVLVGGGTGCVGCHRVAAPVGHGRQVPPRGLRTSQAWLCPGSPPEGRRRPPARSRSPPGPTVGRRRSMRVLTPFATKENHMPTPTLDGLVSDINAYPVTSTEQGRHEP